tara:strand:+ start:747 stop:2537 length:1791 start_codon:yes stop_codon:yes gene_type:complete
MNKLSLYTSLLFLMTALFVSQTYSAFSEEQKKMIESLPPDQRASIMAQMEQAQQLQDKVDEAFEEDSTLIERPEGKLEEECRECIYGYDFFQYSPSTFIQTNNTPVSAEYVLGPGDKIKLNLYGSNEVEVETFISREGVIVIPKLGPINIMGMSLNNASEFLRNEVEQKLIGTNVSISIAELRSISVYVLGEAYKPGKYTMSGLTNVSNALFVTGGVNKTGSLRNIQIKRNNEVIANYDFYDFISNGSTKSDINLQDGDVIYIPFIENKVKVGGAFKRPHLYEFKEGETLKEIIGLAGGFTSEVLPNASIEVSSIDPQSFTRKLSYVGVDSDGLVLKIKNGDVINVSSKAEMQPKTIKITGEVVNPGEYSILPGDTILDILNRAGGYTENAYSKGAIYLREFVAEQQKKGFERSADDLEKTMIAIIQNASVEISEFSLAPISQLVTRLRTEEPLGRFVVDLDYLKLKTDPMKNFRVRSGDSLYIPNRPDSISVVGEVLSASTSSYSPGLNVSDYIDRSGGLNASADPRRIFVILPDGQSTLIKRTFFRSRHNILPGSTIVIPRDARPLDAVNLTEIITPILADLATSAAAIAAISD